MNLIYLFHCMCEHNTTQQQDLAAQVKKGMDKEYPETTWHVIVGTHFGVSITHVRLLTLCM
jgi:hypothetical protein